jgi:hypothetical protein
MVLSRAPAEVPQENGIVLKFRIIFSAASVPFLDLDQLI